MAKPLFWHQGLFLQPQHFQMQDQYTQTLLKPSHKYLTPCFWGIGAMEIQKAALGNRSFNLLSGQFLFKDLTYAILSKNALIQARSFDDAWEEGGKTFDVYLGLKKWNPGGQNVTVLGDLNDLSQVNTRFVTTTSADRVKDLHESGPEAQVRCLQYVLKIFWQTEKERLGDYELLPIARLEHDGDDILLSRNFVPPCLILSAYEPLLKIVNNIRDQVASRSRQLESYKRERGVHTAEFGARDMIYLLALRSLNRYVPLLIHQTEAGEVHPWTVYGVLRQLVGELSTFSEQVSVTGEMENSRNLLLAYDHLRLGECFSGVQALITGLLDDITAGPEYMLQLIFDGTYYTTDLPPAIFEGRNRFYLLFETMEDPQILIDALKSIAKLSSRESLPILIARSLSGIELEYLQTPPQELPRRAQTLYFKLNHHGEQWAQVQKGKNLALYWDTAPEDLKVELMAVGRT